MNSKVCAHSQVVTHMGAVGQGEYDQRKISMSLLSEGTSSVVLDFMSNEFVALVEAVSYWRTASGVQNQLPDIVAEAGQLSTDEYGRR